MILYIRIFVRRIWRANNKAYHKLSYKSFLLESSFAKNVAPNFSSSVCSFEKTVDVIKAKMAECKTLVWNGPLGAFELKLFDEATNEVAAEAARLTKQGKLVSVAGGGDTVSALESAGVAKDFTYISTAGGAFLEWMEGKELPGVKVMEK